MNFREESTDPFYLLAYFILACAGLGYLATFLL